MRRPTAVLLGTLTGALLMTAAKLGTPPLSSAETVAEAPLDRVTDPTSAPASGAADGPAPSNAPSSAPGTQPNPGTTPASGTPMTTAAAPPATGLRSGTFAGPAVTHKYGTLKVTIVTSGGIITDIRWTYSTSLPLSEKINADALPKLRSEALSVQSARVHTVSGATYTSGAYRTSLQSAIDKSR
jgi:uncharacterized protein with FMN-binding domain